MLKSFSSEDRAVAHGLKRKLESLNISVWFFPTTLESADEWMPSIRDGVDNTVVFLALISDSYLKSPFCLGELARFWLRREHTSEPKPVMLPVLLRLRRKLKTASMLRQIIEKYQYIDMATQYKAKLPNLLRSIQIALNERGVSVQQSRRIPARIVQRSRGKAK